MRPTILAPGLLAWGLAVSAFAQLPAPVREPAPALRTHLGTDSWAQVRLAPTGYLGGLAWTPATPPARRPRKPAAEATVEVWDLAPPESNREARFSSYLETLRRRLSRSLDSPPPSHGNIELAELMFSDPGNPQKLDLTRVKSLQERYNHLPPNGSPVR